MLNKDLCKKCWEEAYEKGWTVDDEIRWEEGIVLCIDPISPIVKRLSIEDAPPKGCPKMLEQAVAAGCVNIDKIV
jgi:hypothetical protein